MGVAIYLPPYAQSPPEPALSRGGVGSRSWLAKKTKKKLGSLNVLVHKCLFVLVQKDTHWWVRLITVTNGVQSVQSITASQQTELTEHGRAHHRQRSRLPVLRPSPTRVCRVSAKREVHGKEHAPARRHYQLVI